MVFLLIALSAPPDFHPQLLGVDLHESCAVGDIDQDGRPDVAAGRHWFRNGEWVARPLRQVEDRNGYSMSNSDFLIDCDADGDLDLLSGNYFDGRVTWHENPGPGEVYGGGLWTEHLLFDTEQTTNELNELVDIDRDGRPEWVANQWVATKPLLLWRLSVDGNGALTGAERYQVTPDSSDGDPVNGHGLGFGDITGDGQPELIVRSGWYEYQDSPFQGDDWTFHPDWDEHFSLPILVGQFAGDDSPDLLFGTPHDYGVNLWIGKGRPREFERTVVDASFSQAHAVHLADIDGDGADELITGKRVRAHNGKDPGADDPPQIVYFDLDALDDGPRVIERGRVGIGLKIESADLDADGDIDLVVNGKGGLFVLWNGGAE